MGRVLGWVKFLGFGLVRGGFRFGVCFSISILFLKQTKFKPFEFKFELEFKPHSINKKLCASMTVQQVKPKINFNYLWKKIRLNASYAN